MKHVVTIGGGTGSFITLRGLKKYPFKISAIVSTFDSGGSSGVLSDEFGILPPGDIRRCLVALSDEDAEPTLRQLFAYRFGTESSLSGHSFGNLLLTALTQIVGNYPEAVKRAARILHCKGDIYPVSLEQASLCAELENGHVIRGEANIDHPKHDPTLVIKRMFLEPSVPLYEEVKRVIKEADVIVIGPGDLYTSLVPNLLVDGIHEVLKESRAKKVYICNLMTKLGETHGFKASHFAKTILEYADIPLFDYIVCNSREIGRDHLATYAEENKHPVVIDDEVSEYAHEVITADLFNDADVLRHDSAKIAKIIAQIA